MKKLDSLKQLKFTVEEAPWMASGNYCQGGTHCVVGFLLKNGGATEEQLESLDDLNASPFDFYGIDSILASINHGTYDEDNDFVSPILRDLGFDLEEDKILLSRLQQANDNRGQQAVLELLDKEIKALETNTGEEF